MQHTLDETDIRILRLLQQDARQTNKQIGEKLNKSQSPIYERIKRLQDQGYIKRFTAVIDYKKIGRGLIAFAQVQVKDHIHENLIRFEKQIVQFDEVLACYQMSGEYDFMLRIAVKDLETYHNLLMDKIFKIVPLGSVQSSFVLNEAKSDTACTM